MNTKPILFSEPMVLALLEGRKTQTRRVVKLPHSNPLGEWEATTMGGGGIYDSRGRKIPHQGALWHTRTGDVIASPYGQPGDLLWVRETWANITLGGYPAHYFYRADCDELPPRDDRAVHNTWQPSIHMPREASRLTLRVTEVRVQRVQGISREDVITEGIEPPRCPKCGYTRGDCHLHMDHHLCGLETPTHEASAFASLWDSLHKGREAWAANPWVWVLTFEVLHANVRAVIENRKTI